MLFVTSNSELIMKKIFYALLLTASAFSFSSCRDEDNLPYPKAEEFPVIFTNITDGQSSYKLAEAIGSSNPTATFNIDVKGGDVSAVEAVEIYRSFRGFNVPATGTPILGLGPRLLLRTVPATSTIVEVTLVDMISGLTRATGTSQTGNRTALTRASLKATEGFLVTYELVLKDGRRIVYTPLSNGIVSGTATNAPFSGIVTIIN